MLEEDDEEAGIREIFTNPAEVADVTDEDKGGLVGILLAVVEIILESSERISEEPLYDMKFEEIEKVQKLRRKPKFNFKWIDGNMITKKSAQLKPDYCQFQNKTVVEDFKMILDYAIINLLAGFINCLDQHLQTPLLSVKSVEYCFFSYTLMIVK